MKAGDQYLALGDHLQAVRLYLTSSSHEAVQKSLAVLRMTHNSAVADLVVEHVNNGDGLWGVSNDDSSMLLDMYAALDRLEEGAQAIVGFANMETREGHYKVWRLGHE